MFGDVGSLPTMVTPVCDIDGALCVSPTEGQVIAPPAVSTFVIRPSMATSPAGPKTLSAELFHSSPASVGVSSVPRMSPVVAVPEKFMLFNAAITSQTQPEWSVVHGGFSGWTVSRYSPDPLPRGCVSSR